MSLGGGKLSTRKDMVSQTWILHYFEFADFAGVIQRQNRPVGKSYKSFLV